jgi:ABC-2 type transport system permease protein
MTVFFNIIKRIMKSKLQFISMLIIPAIFLVIISLSTKADLNNLKLSIVNNDNTEFTSKLVSSLKEKASFVDTNELDIRDAILNEKLDYGLVIPNGFTADLIEGKAVKAEGYFLKESIRSFPLQKYIEDYIQAAKAIANASNGDETKFYQGLASFKDGVGLAFIPVKEIDRNQSYATLGMMLMFMLMTSIFFTTLVLTDKENRTFYRSISSPVSLVSYMVQTILAFMVICTIQVTFIFISLKTIVGIYMGTSIINMYLLFMLISLVCVSLGVAISSVSKSVVQACFTGMLIILPMTFLGGCWWNNDMSPDLIRRIGQFTPVYWIMESINNLLNEQSLLSTSKEMLIILIFVIVFFFFGTWRKEDIAK